MALAELEARVSAVAATELAWAAGFFDGEGHSRWRQNSKAGVSLVVTACQSGSDETLRRLQAALGGAGTIRGPIQDPKHPHWTPRYTWAALDYPAIEALVDMWPYLSSVKRDQALAAIDGYCPQIAAREERAAEYPCGHPRTEENATHNGNQNKTYCRTCTLAGARRRHREARVHARATV